MNRVPRSRARAFRLLHLALLCAVGLSAPLTAQERTLLLDDRIAFEMPEGFTPMSEETLKLKYARGRPPQHVFTDDTTKINVAISAIPTPPGLDSSEKFAKAMRQAIGGMLQVNKWGEEGQLTLSTGQPASFFELYTPADETTEYEIFNRFTFIVMDEETAMFNFNRTTDYGEECQQRALALQGSIEQLK